MANMSNTSVKRSGATARYLNHATDDVRATANEGCMRIRFDIDSKGGGTTELYVDVGPADFGVLAAQMVRANRQAALEALSGELNSQIQKQPKNDALTAAKAREEIRSKAYEKYENADSNLEGLESIIYQRIKAIIQEVGTGG